MIVSFFETLGSCMTRKRIFWIQNKVALLKRGVSARFQIFNSRGILLAISSTSSRLTFGKLQSSCTPVHVSVIPFFIVIDVNQATWQTVKLVKQTLLVDAIIILFEIPVV